MTQVPCEPNARPAARAGATAPGADHALKAFYENLAQSPRDRGAYLHPAGLSRRAAILPGGRGPVLTATKGA